jgi:hypothetical protein
LAKNLLRAGGVKDLPFLEEFPHPQQEPPPQLPHLLLIKSKPAHVLWIHYSILKLIENNIDPFPINGPIINHFDASVIGMDAPIGVA